MRLWAERGDRLLLVARDATRLEEVAADLRVRAPGQAPVSTHLMDVTDYAGFPGLMGSAKASDRIDGVLIAHGVLPSQAECESDIDATRRAVEVNATSAVIAMGAFGEMLKPHRGSVLAVLGSVAGDRGRASNFTYGAAKAMVATYAAGLRHRLYPYGVRVLTIKLGFVDTPMTAGFEKKGLLWATPADVAKPIVRAMDSRNGTIYVPWFWRCIMWVIRAMPEAIFVRSRL